jgi:hypothetical protein
MESGSAVERIYFFSGEDIPVAKRHKCQNEIQTTFNVELEIIDAQALAQHLADGDLYWVAIQYLKMPSEMYPHKSEDWYSDMLKEYKETEHKLTTFEEFTDVKCAVRYIYKNNELKKDLLFWLSQLDSFIHGPSTIRPLKRKATYEKFVASLIGLDNVSGLEKEIEDYFSDFERYDSISDLEDSQLLLSFSVNSYNMGRHSLGKEYLDIIATRLETLLDSKINGTENNDTKAGLLEIYANFQFHDVRRDASIETRVNRLVSGINRVIKILPRTTYFGIERFADRFNDYIRLGGFGINTDKLEESARKVDALLGKRGGKELAAEKLRARAISYLKNKDILKAINCLHELKLNWFNADSIQGSILSCLLLADAYAELELHFASKYYALIASFLSTKEKQIDNYKHFLRGISMACNSDYATGSWLNYIELTGLLIMTQYTMTKDFNVYDNDDTYKILYYPAIIKHCANNFLPEVLPIIENEYTKWGFINDDINELLEEKIKKVMVIGELRDSIDEQISGRIFNDIGETRKIEFSALGCNWKFHFPNQYRINAVAEQFISVFQILLADISQEELYIIPTQVSVNISLSKGTEAKWKNLDSNEEIIWNISLPLVEAKTLKGISDLEFQYFVAGQVILFETSLLPQKKYEKILKRKLVDEEIVNKTSFGRPYYDLFQHFMHEGNFNEDFRINTKNEIYGNGYEIKSNSHLPWKSSEAPDYNAKESIQAVKRRVERLPKPVAITLPVLCKSEGFLRTIELIRHKGWLDWQILHVITGITVNYKAQEEYKKAKSDEDLRNISYDLFHKDESEWFQEIPETIFTEERILQDLNVILPITLLNSFNLEYRNSTPNSKAILKLLVKRFHLFEDGQDIKMFP